MNKLQELARQYAETDNDEKVSKEHKDKLKKEILELVGNKPFKNNFMTVSITPEGTTESADKERMIADGIWEKYLKKSPRAGSAKIAVKVEKINEEKEPKQAENIEKSVEKSYDSDKENQSKDCSDNTAIND